MRLFVTLAFMNWATGERRERSASVVCPVGN